MFMPISDSCWLVAASLLLAACSNEPDNAVLAEVEADQVRDAAAAGRIPCALAGADAFRLNCTMERVAGADGETLVLGRPDAGYRRFRITSDGRGVIAADGADVASVTLIDDGQIEVTVATDRYRLPATVKGGE
jgi:hypothetical protein